jgi:hypothetical protein
MLILSFPRVWAMGAQAAILLAASVLFVVEVPMSEETVVLVLTGLCVTLC